jgi:hypothetical protein
MSLLRQHVAGAQAANAFGIGSIGYTAASIAMTASCFSSEHIIVPAIDSRHAFVVVIQKRFDEVNRQTRRLRNIVPVRRRSWGVKAERRMPDSSVMSESGHQRTGPWLASKPGPFIPLIANMGRLQRHVRFVPKQTRSSLAPTSPRVSSPQVTSAEGFRLCRR